MNIEQLIYRRHNHDKPITDSQYRKLLDRFAFYLPIVELPDGEILNPVPDSETELFERFLQEAEIRGEVFNPVF